jgi:hypothetical protein
MLDRSTKGANVGASESETNWQTENRTWAPPRAPLVFSASRATRSSTRMVQGGNTFRLNRRTVLRLAAASPLVVLRMSSVRAEESAPNQTDTDNLRQRGKQLRSALEQTYKAYKAPGPPGMFTDISDVVVPFFPAEISFRDAEVILRSAGFTIEYPNLDKPSVPKSYQYWYAVRAEIAPFVQGSYYRVDAFVLLLPKAVGDYTTVSKVVARFFGNGL